MTQPDPNRPESEGDTSKRPHQGPSDPFNALVSSLFAFPKSIYNRGNEHGRAFTRNYQQEKDDGGEPRPRSARRECARWEGQGYQGRDAREEQPPPPPVEDNIPAQADTKPETVPKVVESKIGAEVDDWVQKIVGELERGEKEARQLYERWMTVSNADPAHQESAKEYPQQKTQEAEPRTSSQTPEGCPWVEMFPSWSAEGHTQGRESGIRQHVFTRDTRDRQELHRPAEDVDETIDKLHKDLGHWLSDADRWRERLQKGFERDSRLWQDEGLFGPSMPFAKPLSSLFSLGMRPFWPEQSAMGYLLHSEYSPLHLEHEAGFDSSFRQRFEDLLRAEDGKAMMNKEECASVNTTSGVEWLGRIIPLLKQGENGGRGRMTCSSSSRDSSVLQEQKGQTAFDGARHTLEGYSGGPQTEQDMYDHYFSKFPREPFQVPSVTGLVPQESQNRSSRPGILSTMTRTERHVAPDGSVTTKTVLKKSYADGSEENSETTETTPATKPAWREQRSEAERGLGFEIAKSKPTPGQEPKRGWFWSS